MVRDSKRVNGADTKGGRVRVPLCLLEHFQRQVALETVSKSGCCFGTEIVFSQTASTGAEAGA